MLDNCALAPFSSEASGGVREGGQKKLIDNLIASDREALECVANTRVDNKSDELNKILINYFKTSKQNWWQKLFRV